MPTSKPMGILDVGAAACQPSHPSLCLRARVFRSKNLHLRRVACVFVLVMWVAI
jgi:hypothetical protein